MCSASQGSFSLFPRVRYYKKKGNSKKNSTRIMLTLTAMPTINTTFLGAIKTSECSFTQGRPRTFQQASPCGCDYFEYGFQFFLAIIPYGRATHDRTLHLTEPKKWREKERKSESYLVNATATRIQGARKYMVHGRPDMLYCIVYHFLPDLQS